MRKTVLFAAVLIVSSFSLAARAQNNTPDDTAPNTGDSYDESQNPGQGEAGMENSLYTPTMTLDRIHAINLEEIDAGNLALHNGSRAIHSYAEKLVKAHEKADSMVKGTAKAQKLTLRS